MNDPRAADAIRRWERLNSDRGTTLWHWQQVADLMIPDRADYTIERTPGMKRQQLVYDATAPWAVQQFAAGLHGYMISPTERWFSLKPDDDALEYDEAAHAFFDACSNAMYSRFNSPRLNFAAGSHSLLVDEATIGTACMAVLERPNGDILFSSRHMREICIEENEDDRVDGVVRRWRWTARQAFDEWGDAAGERVRKAVADGNDHVEMTFYHQVRPRAARNPNRRDARHKPYESLYIAEAGQEVIAEGGFDEFPFLVPRFDMAPGEVYGRSIGMTMLPHVKMLNQMMQTVLIGAQKVIDPPYSYPEDGYLMPIRMRPGAGNPYRAGMRDRIEPIETKGDTRLGVDLIGSVREQIVRGFYVDWMVMPSDLNDPASAGKGVTATFTTTQRDQKMRMLSPLLARQRSEFLGPLIQRVFAILWRQSVAMRFGPGSPFPAPPPQLRGMPWRVEYISPAEIAQRGSSIDAIDKLVQTALMLAQIDPSVPMILNADGMLRDVARTLNTPAASLNAPDVVARMKAQLQARQDSAQQSEGLANLAGAANDGTKAVLNLAQAQQQPQAAVAV